MFRRRKTKRSVESVGIHVGGCDDETLGTYSAIPLKIMGTTDECRARLEAVLPDVINRLRSHGVEIPEGTEALNALYATLQTSMQLEEKRTADRAARQ